MICVADFRDLRPQQSRRESLQTLSPTFPVHCNKRNSITATKTGLSQTCHGLCRKHLDMSRRFVSSTFVICVGNYHRNFIISSFHDLSLFMSATFMMCVRVFPHREVSVKVGIIEFGLYCATSHK